MNNPMEPDCYTCLEDVACFGLRVVTRPKVGHFRTEDLSSSLGHFCLMIEGSLSRTFFRQFFRKEKISITVCVERGIVEGSSAVVRNVREFEFERAILKAEGGDQDRIDRSEGQEGLSGDL
jgi:hypothetical protein